MKSYAHYNHLIFMNEALKPNSSEQQPNFDIQSSLEKVQGVSNVLKLELDAAYLDWARENIKSPEVYETIKSNHEALEAYTFKYLSDGLSISGYLWAPRGITQPLPITIWNRGGTREAGSLGDKEGKLGPIYLDIPCELAKQGTVVVASEYRGGLNSEGEDTWGGEDIHDVIHIKEIADQLPVCKSGKAIVAGKSRGGMMSYLLAAKEPWVKAVISLSGEADLASSAEDQPEFKQIFIESFGGSEKEMEKRSATHFYGEIPKDLPMFIMQGEDDTHVLTKDVRRLYELLSTSGHNVEYHEFPNAGHTFYGLGSPQRKEALEIIERFLKAQL